LEIVLHDAPPAVPPPVYADRATGASYPTAFEMVNAYIERYVEKTGTELARLDGTGYSQVKRGSAHVGINVLEDNGVLMLLAPLRSVPSAGGGGGGREAFYRRLLELSFLATSDAAFAIDGKADLVYVRALRRLSGLDYEEFEDLLQTVSQVADEWDDVLTREYGP
jgi:hypothetical protein